MARKNVNEFVPIAGLGVPVKFREIFQGPRHLFAIVERRKHSPRHPNSLRHLNRGMRHSLEKHPSSTPLEPRKHSALVGRWASVLRIALAFPPPIPPKPLRGTAVVHLDALRRNPKRRAALRSSF